MPTIRLGRRADRARRHTDGGAAPLIPAYTLWALSRLPLPPADNFQQEEVERGALPTGGEERLGAGEATLEEVFLGLRTRTGVPAASVPAGREEPYMAAGLLSRREDRFVLTDRGMFLAGEVATGLVG